MPGSVITTGLTKVKRKISGLEPIKQAYSCNKEPIRACITQRWLLEEFTEADMSTVYLIRADRNEDFILSSISLDILLEDGH